MSLLPIEKLELDINISEKIVTQSGVIIEDNVDYTKIFKDNLIKSNPFYEIQEYRNIKYVTELLNLCGTSSLTANDRKILKDCSFLQGLLKLPHLNTQYKTYKNFAYFTAIIIVAILFLVLFKFRSHDFIKWVLYVLCLYCVLHVTFLRYNGAIQKDFDKELKVQFKNGCF